MFSVDQLQRNSKGLCERYLQEPTRFSQWRMEENLLILLAGAGEEEPLWKPFGAKCYGGNKGNAGQPSEGADQRASSTEASAERAQPVLGTERSPGAGTRWRGDDGVGVIAEEAASGHSGSWKACDSHSSSKKLHPLHTSLPAEELGEESCFLPAHTCRWVILEHMDWRKQTYSKAGKLFSILKPCRFL